VTSAPTIGPLSAHHDRASFVCGEPALEAYLQRQASQDMRRRIAQVFIASFDEPSTIIGYYTLSAATILKSDLPEGLAKRLPHYPVPAAVLGRLAVSSAHQGRGLGEFLLLDAVRRVLHASTAMAVYAVVVEAKNDQVAAFYGRYGFLPFPTMPLRLFLPLDDFIKAGL
jgi:GNAT superfamily N-acetyltransferase